MSGLSNVFSALNLDAEDDKEQIASLTTASGIDGCSKRISGKKGEGDKQNYELTVKRAHSESDKSHNNIHPSLSSSLSGSYKQPLVWIDLEMTGLEIEVDRILEIACIITDGKLNKSVEGPDLVIKQSKECLDRMGEWCREHHAASGLTERVLQSTITEEDAEEQKYMPCLAGIFPHVLVDVSSITALCVRWFPKERKTAPTKVKRHRAMDDIKESIRELKYYKENIFKGFRKSK
ncbi:oligoribonuclease isoform X4 [Phalaenopsis equestris]|uniref:oligoribonuclease isoform X4 n=1 Tax=Phalaenopsis equestris TaxID=78828 RepID=UPI0009E55ABA|nr:oligoribonuclease isoform X4 [Phalaenopsis equestris]